MKKFFCFIISLVLILAMTTIAFAIPPSANQPVGDSTETSIGTPVGDDTSQSVLHTGGNSVSNGVSISYSRSDSTFYDVPVTSPYFDAVEYLHNKGIINGSGNGMFYPDKYMTGGEFAIMTFHALFPDETVEPVDCGAWYTPYVEYLLEHDVITNSEAAIFYSAENGKVSLSWEIVWRVLLPQFGVFPYPADMTDVKPVDKITGSYADARAAAILLGLTSEDTYGLYSPTRGEAAAFLYRLMTGRYTELPEITYQMPHIEGLDIIDKTNYLARNTVIYSWPKIPQKIRDDFVENGWTIRVGKYTEDSRHEVPAGLTVYQEKTVYLNQANYDTLLHEIGHYVSYRYGITQQLKAFYDRESHAAEPVLGNYAMTSSDEFFAEAFAFCITHPDDHDKLLAAAPCTFILINDAILDADGMFDALTASILYRAVCS